jgi:uncharacterized protein (DUF849 family)
MNRLPNIMVAPNGARHSKADHPALPLTLPEILHTAKDCFAAGAGGLHLHLRGAGGQHILDAGLYREAVQALNAALPDMVIQITTEAAGIFEPPQQMQVALQSGVTLVSASVRELARGQSPDAQRAFYIRAAEQGLHIQHILYSPADLHLLKSVLPENQYRHSALQLLFVLGKYGDIASAAPAQLDPYLQHMQQEALSPDWAICAFGMAETRCLLYARRKGGKIRVGFENSFWNADKSIAPDNAARVRELARHRKNPSE